jgi:signal transduction histidine kinase
MNAHTFTRNAPKLRNFNPFASALAHEVRNPLTNINLAIDMLTSTALDNDQKIYVDIIKRASFRINGLVTELLVSGEPGEIPFDNQPIHQLLDEVLAMTEDRIRLKNITVRKDYSTIDCNILMNRQQIKTALVSIIINAIEAMPAESGKLKLGTRSINGQCIITIEDNGIGISKENLPNIFKPYFTSKPGGMGLGLSTTLEILNANHAMVKVKSEIGVGTWFLLSFEGIQP